MNAVKAELVCIFDGQKYVTPVSVNVEDGFLVDMEIVSEKPPTNASLEKEYVIYDEEIFHIQFDDLGNYSISDVDLDDFKAHVMG